MKKKLTKEHLNKIEQEMKDDSLWNEADHVVVYKGPTSIRFAPDLLKKLQSIARAKGKTLGKLVNDYVRVFVESEFPLLKGSK